MLSMCAFSFQFFRSCVEGDDAPAHVCVSLRARSCSLALAAVERVLAVAGATPPQWCKGRARFVLATVLSLTKLKANGGGGDEPYHSLRHHTARQNRPPYCDKAAGSYDKVCFLLLCATCLFLELV
ncbi:hypothetical protein evm_011342 [Chilo suppressalis]|nr:hypothetical protein evm_011342 [Chilo suppressalis]